MKQQIDKQKLPGIKFIENPARLYPNGTFASHVVGLTKSSGSGSDAQLTGILGIEKLFNKTLKGTNGHQQLQTDRYGYTLPNSQKSLRNLSMGAVCTPRLIVAYRLTLKH